MSTKSNPSKVSDCYANAEPDEPMFVLLGRDKNAPQLVEMWAAQRMACQEDPAKIEEALKCAKAMRRWHYERKGAPVCEYCATEENDLCDHASKYVVSDGGVCCWYWCGNEETTIYNETKIWTIGEYFASNAAVGNGEQPARVGRHEEETGVEGHGQRETGFACNGCGTFSGNESDLCPRCDGESDKFTMTLVLSFDDEDLPDAEVICLDLQSLNDIVKVSDWLARNADDIRSQGRLLMLATGTASVDLSNIGRYVNGIFERPMFGSIDDWIAKAMPLWLSIRHPECVDVLSSESTQGGVSAEEFAETLRHSSTGVRDDSDDDMFPTKERDEPRERRECS